MLPPKNVLICYNGLIEERQLHSNFLLFPFPFLLKLQHGSVITAGPRVKTAHLVSGLLKVFCQQIPSGMFVHERFTQGF